MEETRLPAAMVDVNEAPEAPTAAAGDAAAVTEWSPHYDGEE